MSKTRPWGVNALHNMVSPGGVSTFHNGRVVRAVPEPYAPNLFEALRAAWWVLRGRAHAVVWPKPGELERATGDLPDGLPRYPDGEVTGPCVCGSWPGGHCLRCDWADVSSAPKTEV